MVAHTHGPVYFATYTAPDGEELHGTAQDTCLGWKFIDEAGTAPVFADLRALHLHGLVALVAQQRAADDRAARWMGHMLATGCVHATA